MSAPSDAELLQRWRAGDRSASEALMRRHYAGVRRYFELNASNAADDLVQATFVACVERVEHVRDSAAFRAYLMGIARRKLAMHLRELSRAPIADGFEEPAPQQTQLSTLVARNREQFLVLRALASIPRAPQMLLILFYWERMQTPQLAEALGVNVSTVRTRLARARERLRKRMNELAGAGVLPDAQSEDWLPGLLAAVVAPEVPVPPAPAEKAR